MRTNAMPLSVSHVCLKVKQPCEVFRGCGGDFFASTPKSPARPRRLVTQAGSLRLPRLGAGASQGASVSTRMPSSGMRAATSRSGWALG
jgi:hypothetical protein